MMKSILGVLLLLIVTANASAVTIVIDPILSGKTQTAEDFNAVFEQHIEKEKLRAIESRKRLDAKVQEWEIERQEKLEQERLLASKPDAKIGMTQQQVLNDTNWGKPKYVNTTINAYGRSEQWVYGTYQYLYFKNGRAHPRFCVTAI